MRCRSLCVCNAQTVARVSVRVRMRAFLPPRACARWLHVAAAACARTCIGSRRRDKSTLSVGLCPFYRERDSPLPSSYLSLFLSYSFPSVFTSPSLLQTRCLAPSVQTHRYTHAFSPPLSLSPSISFSFSRGRSSIREDAHIGSASMHSFRSRHSDVRE